MALPWVSKASDGSEPNRVWLVPDSGGGRGTSTPPQLPPPSDEKYARMGSRKITLDPAVSWRGPVGFKVMKVSLCGPHSFDTSTLLPKLVAVAGAPPPSGPLAARY